MRKGASIGIAGVFAICASAMAVMAAPAPPRDLASICLVSPCRTAVTEFRLTDSAGGTFILNTALVPYADEGRVNLFAGEIIGIAFPASGVNEPRFVRTAESLEAGPPRSLTLRLAQSAGRADMGLDIQSTLDMPVMFDAVLYIPTPRSMGERRIYACLVAANGLTRQTWPYPVATMVLSNFRAATSAQGDCR